LARDSLAIREEDEWYLADRIVCGSEFVIRGLAALDVELVKCRVVPYGIDLSRFQSRNNYRDRLRNRKLKVLFVGEVGLRKGVPYLLEALRKIGSKGVEARFAGEVVLNKKKLRRYAEESEFLGAVPRVEMEKLYQWADVLVLPSICEGFGIVHIEAFANGVAVVATPNSGTIVRDGIDGQVVPIRDSDAIAEVFERYISKPDYLQQHQQAARQGCERLGLAAYREKVVSIIREIAN
jgi:glycosyltransferase involved in cell wall biosynthesis